MGGLSLVRLPFGDWLHPLPLEVARLEKQEMIVILL